MNDPRLPRSKPPSQAFDPPDEREPMPWPTRPEPRRLIARGAFHNGTPADPSHQHQGSRTGARGYSALDTKVLKPLYTEKLPTSPRFPTLAEAAQRRRDFWGKVIGRSGLVIMVLAPFGAWWRGMDFPLGAFAIGLIIFIATCFYGGCRNRHRI